MRVRIIDKSSYKELPKINKVGYFINLHGKADNGVTYYIDGKAYTREEYNKLVKEKSEKIAEEIVEDIITGTIIICYLLLPVLLVIFWR